MMGTRSLVSMTSSSTYSAPARPAVVKLTMVFSLMMARRWPSTSAKLRPLPRCPMSSGPRFVQYRRHVRSSVLAGCLKGVTTTNSQYRWPMGVGAVSTSPTRRIGSAKDPREMNSAPVRASERTKVSMVTMDCPMCSSASPVWWPSVWASTSMRSAPCVLCARSRAMSACVLNTTTSPGVYGTCPCASSSRTRSTSSRRLIHRSSRALTWPPVADTASQWPCATKRMRRLSGRDSRSICTPGRFEYEPMWMRISAPCSGVSRWLSTHIDVPPRRFG
mmetsp:Transcript_7121/g.25367  ORF Transcript_7121/g.25367 Transcript_7121/m.25367 type:complete len:276 (+) Transcript_7121:1205-2032(+)